MRAFLADAEQALHYPEHFLVNGVMRPNPEQPERIARLKAGARKAGCAFERPQEHAMSAIASTHTPEYLRFMESAHERWRRIDGAAPAITPNIHPNRRDFGYPHSVVAQAGYHMLDAGAPVMEATFESALWSARCAISAADAITNGARDAYALCRPPGHHATADAAAGFCYFNNAAIAAERLRGKFPRIAILDVDVHHGNGTQDIFYARGDVLTVSIHCDPRRFYPFFWGYADERGEGAGLGFNLNLPLARGTGDEEFLAAVDAGLQRIAAFAPDAVIIALGLDASIDDPFAGLAVTTQGFGRIGETIGGGVSAPTLIVQEGGYLCPSLGDNLAAFLSGFSERRAR